ncbi:Membrane-bound metallopeptidase [Ignavibacterium album JCM 16511]|uniref:Membrane-bound metallopeptidase n=1 Tax=Ignavibacterium album (strain DSM 19864 / JCM 16511 / NBRC 101810 / Mat9-16) TaxID=945713 RepID=I0ALB0_IGNAJ|nr:Membrane-bound metallopeptidase [Ignavibacterium album JCM 16511]
MFSFILLAQDAQLDKKKKELEKIRSELQQLEDELTAKSKKERLTYESYNNLNRQSHLISKLISKLQKEENIKQTQIENIRKEISQIESEIESIKNNYAKYVAAIYKYGKTSELESIIDAHSFNQAFLRIKYLREFSNRRKLDIERLQENKVKLSDAKLMLSIELEEKRKLKEIKESEITQLNKRLDNEKKLLAVLRKDKSNISKKLNDRKKAEIQIRNLISKVIEESEKKKEMIASTDKKVTDKKVINNEAEYDIDLSTKNFASFSEMKGSMIWPVTKGKIITAFGEQRNPKLNTVTVSYGIDILAHGELSVKVVADGVVSAVEWLPGYGTVIIISHKGGYKTVYGHLAEVYVNEGDRLNTGGLIGKVGESFEGNVLHFQIWNGRQSVNPENWLRK